MFCPKCATQNLDGASFCRGCGANISLVSQAMTGQITPPQQPAEQEVDEGGAYCSPGRRRGRKLTLEHSFKNIFMGVAFLLISFALALSRVGTGWWFWMLLPGFVLMGTGLAQYIRLRENMKQASLAPPPMQRSFSEPPRHREELRPPVASVTEGTTRHLGVEAPTRHLDASERR
ncbi:MAG TPA: zinc ribbon domain-containing protein [Pyrinomonadaceae bacterium]